MAGHRADLVRRRAFFGQLAGGVFADAVKRAAVWQPNCTAPFLEPVSEALEAERLAPFRHQVGQVLGAEGVEALGQLWVNWDIEVDGLRCSFLAYR